VRFFLNSNIPQIKNYYNIFCLNIGNYEVILEDDIADPNTFEYSISNVETQYAASLQNVTNNFSQTRKMVLTK